MSKEQPVHPVAHELKGIREQMERQTRALEAIAGFLMETMEPQQEQEPKGIRTLNDGVV